MSYNNDSLLQLHVEHESLLQGHIHKVGNLVPEPAGSVALAEHVRWLCSTVMNTCDKLKK